MALFSFKRRVADPPDSGEVSKGRRTIKRSPPVAMEVKLLALEGLEAGLSAEEVGELSKRRLLVRSGAYLSQERSRNNLISSQRTLRFIPRVHRRRSYHASGIVMGPDAGFFALTDTSD